MARRAYQKPIDDNTGKKAVLYGRYSSHNQRDASIEQQFAECRQYAKERGIVIIGEYADRHISGQTDKRPEFQRMIKDSYKGLFEIVLCWKVDRFARNREDAAIYKGRLRVHGVRLLYAKEPIPDGSAGILLETMLEGTAEWYSVALSENIRRGMDDNARQCKINGGFLPLGYKRGEDGRYAIEPQGAEIVQEVYQLYAAGASIVDICNTLNMRGLRTSKGALWNKNSLRTILRNEKYIGVYKHSETRIEGGVPVIIEKELFDEVQDMIKKNAKSSRGSGVDFLLSGKLYCGKCGTAMLGESGTGRSKIYYYYKCATRKRGGGCDMRPVKKGLIEDTIARLIVDTMLRDDMIDFIATDAVRYQIEERKNSPIEDYKQKHNEVVQKINNIVKAVEQGMYNTAMNARMNELEEQRQQLEYAIKDAEITTPLIPKGDIVKWLKSLKQGDINDDAVKNQLFEAFLNSVYLYDDKIRIICNYIDGNGDNEITIDMIDELLEDYDSVTTKSVRITRPMLHQMDIGRTSTFSKAVSPLKFASDVNNRVGG